MSPSPAHITYSFRFQEPFTVFLEASGTELPGVKAVEKLISYVLAKIDLAFGDSVTAARA
jgi:hypothetical protein